MRRKPADETPTGRGRDGGPAIAFWLEYPSLPACEIAALAGYDSVIFDLEHGVIPRAAADALALACKRLGLIVYSRVATAARADIQQALDSGVDGVILPQLADLARIAGVAAGCGKAWAPPAPGARVFEFAVRNGAALVAVCDDLTALRLGFAQGLAVTSKG